MLFYIDQSHSEIFKQLYINIRHVFSLCSHAVVHYIIKNACYLLYDCEIFSFTKIADI